MRRNKLLVTVTSLAQAAGVRRAIMWGMAIHSLIDTFSHSVFIKGSDAQYNNPTHPCGTYKEFNSILEATTFKLGNISTYIQDVTKNQGISAKYMYVNYCL